jgi:hypothetical protein
MLKNFVSVYVPSTNGTRGALAPETRQEVLTDVARKLALEFGGCTAQEGLGFWVSDSDQGLVQERVTIVTSFYDSKTVQPAAALVFAESIAKTIKALLNQEAVTVQTESGLEFV